MSPKRVVCIKFALPGTTPLAQELEVDCIRIGRDPRAEISLPDPVVSRIHAVIELRELDWELADMRSTNGLTVNGRCEKRRKLQQGDLVAVGPWHLHVTHCSATGALWIEARPSRAPEDLHGDWRPNEVTLRRADTASLN